LYRNISFKYFFFKYDNYMFICLQKKDI
jgi:hypothetical protein